MNINSSNPDGKGTFKITAIGQNKDTMTVFMEGKVEGYGFVTLTHKYKHIDHGNCEERSGGTIIGSAEANFGRRRYCEHATSRDLHSQWS